MVSSSAWIDQASEKYSQVHSRFEPAPIVPWRGLAVPLCGVDSDFTWRTRSTHLGELKRLGSQAFSTVIRYCLVYQGTTVDAFPSIKH